MTNWNDFMVAFHLNQDNLKIRENIDIKTWGLWRKEILLKITLILDKEYKTKFLQGAMKIYFLQLIFLYTFYLHIWYSQSSLREFSTL